MTNLVLTLLLKLNYFNTWSGDVHSTSAWLYKSTHGSKYSYQVTKNLASAWTTSNLSWFLFSLYVDVKLATLHLINNSFLSFQSIVTTSQSSSFSLNWHNHSSPNKKKPRNLFLLSFVLCGLFQQRVIELRTDLYQGHCLLICWRTSNKVIIFTTQNNSPNTHWQQDCSTRAKVNVSNSFTTTIEVNASTLLINSLI